MAWDVGGLFDWITRTFEISFGSGDRTTDSGEAIRNRVDTLIGTPAADIAADVAAVKVDTGKIPKSDGSTVWNATAQTTIQTKAAAALTAYDPPTRTEATSDKDEILAGQGGGGGGGGGLANDSIELNQNFTDVLNAGTFYGSTILYLGQGIYIAASVSTGVNLTAFRPGSAKDGVKIGGNTSTGSSINQGMKPKLIKLGTMKFVVGYQSTANKYPQVRAYTVNPSTMAFASTGAELQIINFNNDDQGLNLAYVEDDKISVAYWRTSVILSSRLITYSGVTGTLKTAVDVIGNANGRYYAQVMATDSLVVVAHGQGTVYYVSAATITGDTTGAFTNYLIYNASYPAISTSVNFTGGKFIDDTNIVTIISISGILQAWFFDVTGGTPVPGVQINSPELYDGSRGTMAHVNSMNDTSLLVIELDFNNYLFARIFTYDAMNLTGYFGPRISVNSEEQMTNNRIMGIAGDGKDQIIIACVQDDDDDMRIYVGRAKPQSSKSHYQRLFEDSVYGTGTPNSNSVTSSASANTFGVWAAIFANVRGGGFLHSLTHIFINTGENSWIIEVGVGQSGSQKIVARISGHARRQASGEADSSSHVLPNFYIPPYQDLWARIADSQANAYIHKIGITLKDQL